MPHFKSFNLYLNRPKIVIFAKKKTKKNSLPLQISGYAPDSSLVFALLISTPTEFFQMPRLKSIHFYQNKPRIKLFLQNKINFFEFRGLRPTMASGGALTPPNTALTPLPISGYVPDIKRVLLILPSFRNGEKFIELAT